MEVNGTNFDHLQFLTCLTGFSWLTNQYGLSLDTIVAMELVKPDGVVANVTQDSDPELFFALKVRLHIQSRGFALITWHIGRSE